VATADQTSGGSSVAITSATQVAGTQMFIGPDSAKSNVSQQAGRVYRATDTQVEYYSDGQQWVKFGVGSAQESVPQVRSAESPTNVLASESGVPTPTAHFSGPTHGEGADAFIGAALAPDGQVILAPNDSSNVGVVDVSGGSISYQSGPTHGEGGGAFRGAALAPDGQVILAPFDSSNVGVVDVSGGSVSYQSGPTHGEGGGAFQGAALAPDGQVILAPNGSSNVGVVAQSLSVAAATQTR